MNLHSIETPALVLDLDRLEANAARMQARMDAHGVALRPHLKTAKSASVAELAIAQGARGIAVATLQEAEYFLSKGITDLQYPVCIVPGKFERAARLIRQGAQLGVILDSLAVAEALAAFATQQKLVFKVYLEIDSGEHRTGFSLPNEDFLAAARLLEASQYVDFRGVLTHGGHSYRCTSVDELRAVAVQERLAAVEAAELLRHSGLPCPEVSLGSTPTACFGESFEGVTEVRAGVYLFGDLFQSALGTCERTSLAVSVLATVISRNPAGNTVVVDAGGLALSKDRSRVTGGPDTRYGLVADLGGTLLAPDTTVFDVHQEHGELHANASPHLAELQVGSRLRIFPNHACMTAAMYDRYHLVRGSGTEVLQIWDKTQGW